MTSDYEHPVILSNSNLPNSWIKTTVGSVTKIASGGTPSTKRTDYFRGSVPWITPADFSVWKAKYISKGARNISETGLKNSSAVLLPEGTVVFSSRAPIGYVAIAANELATNQGCKNFLPSDRIFNEYLYYFLKASKALAEQHASGTTFLELSAKNAAKIPVPLPPIAEQHRIVTKIEELFTRLDAASTYLELVKAQLKQYHRSVLKRALEGKLTEEWREAHKGEIEPAAVNLERLWQKLSKKAKKGAEAAPCLSVPQSAGLPESWAYGKLGDWIYIAGRIGWRGLKAQEYTNDGALFLSAHNLGRGELVDLSHGYHLSEARYEESPEIKLEEDDILLVKDGAGIGRIGIVKRLEREATVNSSLLVVRSRDAFTPKFLFYLLKGPKMQEIVRKRITGSATPHLFQRDIKQLELLIPPLSEQQEIVNEVERRLSNIEDMEKALDISLKRGRSLRQSILERAFEGKLVQQDPKEEQSSIFLEATKDAKLQKQANTNSADHQKTLQMELHHYVK